MSGHWRASVHGDADWRVVRPPAGPYDAAALVEWGSITKGLVGTAVARSLPLDLEVRTLAPRFAQADFTVRDLVDHTSGLPRLPVGMGLLPFGDPYRKTVGRRLDPATVLRATERGEFVYSNLGYALLGELLDALDGSWFQAVREHVLEPAGITTATVDPPGHARVMARRFGRAVTPWVMTGSPYAASGGVWSTFEDLCRYGAWATAEHGDPTRTVTWQHRHAARWINGQVRAASVEIVSAAGATAVVHGLAQRLSTVDRIATDILRETVGKCRGARA